MRIGARLVDDHHHHNLASSNGGSTVGYIGTSKAIRKRKKRCTRREKRCRPMALQELFVACRDIFKGPGTVPPPEDVQQLSRILGEFKILSFFFFFG